MTQKLSIPVKYPKWMQPLNEFLDEKKPGKHSLTFIEIESCWPNFVAKCGKPKVVKTKEEKEAAKALKLNKQIKNANLWEEIAKSGNADTNLLRFAVSMKDRLAAEKEQQRSAKKRRRDEEEEEEEEGEEMQEDEAEEGEEEGEEGEEEGDVEEEEGDVEEEGEEEEGEDEKEKKDTDDVRQSIEEQLQKKVPIKELEKDKTEFYSIIAEYGIGVDEKVAKLFNRMFDRAVSQTKALDTVETLIHTVLE